MFDEVHVQWLCMLEPSHVLCFISRSGMREFRASTVPEKSDESQRAGQVDGKQKSNTPDSSAEDVVAPTGPAIRAGPPKFSSVCSAVEDKSSAKILQILDCLRL